jgi:hypothetical protein
LLSSPVLLAGLFTGLASTSGAMAQDQALAQCSCVTPMSSAPSGGSVTPISGNVTVTTVNSVVRIVVQAPLAVNSQFAIGRCAGDVGSERSVTISRIGDNICVQETEETLLGGFDGGTAGILAGAAAAGGGIILFSVGLTDLSK